MPSFGLVSHFFNEELLLPYWLKHHVPLFDQGIMIDHHSTDSSREIIKSLAPDWKIIDTGMENFDCFALDAEVMAVEETLKTDYKMVLNTTEFMWNHNFRKHVEFEMTERGIQALGFRNIVMIDPSPDMPMEEPLYRNRHYGFVDNSYTLRRPRYIHNQPNGQYQLGRHGVNLSAHIDPNLFILYNRMSPWPACLPRLLGVQSKIPQEHKNARLGWEHVVTEEQLQDLWESYPKHNLLEFPEFKREYDKFLLDINSKV